MHAIFSYTSFYPLLFILKLSETAFHFRLISAWKRQNCNIWMNRDLMNGSSVDGC